MSETTQESIARGFSLLFPHYGGPCPDGPHRGPQGPNEDLAQCGKCGMVSFGMRPSNETFGEHLDDCSLDIHHPSYCAPGGKGHHRAARIRG